MSKWKTIHKQLLLGEQVVVFGCAEVTVRTTLSKLLAAERKALLRFDVHLQYSAVRVRKSETSDGFVAEYVRPALQFAVVQKPEVTQESSNGEHIHEHPAQGAVRKELFPRG